MSCRLLNFERKNISFRQNEDQKGIVGVFFCFSVGSFSSLAVKYSRNKARTIENHAS